MGEVESILGCNAELEQEEIIWFHQDLPSDLWVCGTNAMISDIQRSGAGMPLSIDPTFNHGKFEVTPLTYRHQHGRSVETCCDGRFNHNSAK